MENIKNNITDIYNNSQKFIELNTRIVKLEIYERITNIIASGLSGGIIVIFGLFSFLFINLGVAFKVSEYYNSKTTGFLIIGLFYFIVLIIYLLLRKKIGKNKIKNSILLAISKDMDDFEVLLKEQDITYKDIDATKEKIKTDINTLKHSFGKDDNTEVENTSSRGFVTSAINLILKKVLLRNSGIVVKNLVPIVANTLATSKLFNESKTTSLIENIKMKLKSMFS